MAFPLSFRKLSNATWVILPGSGPATVGVSTYIKHQSRKSFPSMSIAQPDKSHPSFEVLFFFFFSPGLSNGTQHTVTLGEGSNACFPPFLYTPPSPSAFNSNCFALRTLLGHREQGTHFRWIG